VKIIYISNSIIPSKTANSIHVMKMCQALADNGHNVILFAPNRYKEFEKNIDDVYDYYNVKKNFDISFLPYSYMKYFGIINYSINVYKKVQNVKPDLVYGRDLYSCFLTSFIQNTAYEIHAPMNNKIKSFLLNVMNKNRYYKKTVVISSILQKIIINSQNIVEEKIYVAHDAADELLNFDNKISTITDNSKLNVGYVGSLYTGKGIEVIMGIAHKLPNLMFHIVGGKEDDILYWQEKSISNNIKFHGFVTQKNIYKYLNSFDVLLLPNQPDIYIENKKDMNIGEYTSPLKMFEYMSSKKVIISSNLPVLREVLNNSNAMLVNPNNYSEWISALNKVRDKILRKRLYNQAYLDFKSKYTWRKRANKILASMFI